MQLRQARQTVIRFYRLQSSVVNSVATVTPIAVTADCSQPIACAVTTPQGTAVATGTAGTRQNSSLKALESGISGGCSWVSVFNNLNVEIKLRHYSPKTLKSYRGWTRHFQTFTRSKDFQTLTQQDVVDFLTHLAVKKQVSASTQNQAFNALLFLYKHVLKREFGEIKGVARAKRSPRADADRRSAIYG